MFTPQKRYRRKVVTEYQGESLTEQQHLDQTSIHRIMARYRKAGVFDHVQQYQGTYMDITGKDNLHENLNKMIEAQELFDSVPAAIRQDFNNSAAEFIDFMQNPENRLAIEEYGLDASHLPECKEPPPAAEFTPPRGDSAYLPPKAEETTAPEPSAGSADEG